MKKFLIVILSISMIFTFFNVNISTKVSADTVYERGSCGSCTWTLRGDSKDLTLNIYGSGKMEDYQSRIYCPYIGYGVITEVYIGDGVTHIGANSLSFSYTTVRIPSSVVSIGWAAFNFTTSLSITYDACVNKWNKISIGEYNDEEIGNAKKFFKNCTSDWKLEQKPTCTSEGYYFKDCDYCGKNYKYISPLGHTYGEWEIDTEPTCTESGLKFAKCTVCGHKKEEEIPAAHRLGEYITEAEPTCTMAGLMYKTCEACGMKEQKELPATGHTYGEWVTTINPNCTMTGLMHKTCEVCGIKKQKELPATGHTYGEWLIERKPTCTKTGVEVKSCLICGDRQEQSIPIIDHNFNVYLDVNFPDCTQDGRRVIKCSGCSEQKTIETTGNHIYKNGKCTGCDIAEEIIESEHNYTKNTDYTWTVTKENAAQIDVKFSDQTVTEANYDFIYIYDGNDNLIGQYSGTTLAGQTITVSGDTVKIKLTSDSSSQKWGFYATVTPKSIVGDTNGDNTVNALDILNVQDAVLMGIKADAYDVNGDGLVNLIDLVRIKKILAVKA